MTSTSTKNPSSIFADGKLKPGTYKIQNLSNDNFLDIHELSKEVRCYPILDLREGMGIVCLHPLSVTPV